MSEPKFEYGDYRLRKPIAEDAAGFIAICADPEVMRYYGSSGAFIKTIEDAEKEIAWGLGQFEKNAGRWIVVEKAEDAYIGDIGFFNFQEPHNRVEIGYRLKREYWGRGIVGGFLRQLVRFGFTEKKYNRIEATVDARNDRSKKVLLKNGFRLEGTFREYECENGEFVDIEMYAILKKDY